MLSEFTTGALSASLSEGPAWRGGASATRHTLVRTCAAWLMPVLICSITCGGIPHQVALSVAYLYILACAAWKTVNRWQASFGWTLRLAASWIIRALFLVLFCCFVFLVLLGGCC